MSIELDEMKVWIFYLKSRPDDVYGFTTVKKYKDQFLETRNKKAFKIETLVMDELEFAMFANNYKNQMMVECPLGYGTEYQEYVTLIMTTAEEIKLNEYVSKVEHEMEDLYRSLVLHSGFKSKYKQAIEYLLDTGYELQLPNGPKINASRFNMLLGFTVLFKDTMQKGT